MYDWRIIVLMIIATAFLTAGGFIFSRRLKKESPVLLSFILQRDDCSRLIGEFSEYHLAECSKLVLVWQNGGEVVKAIKSDSVATREEAARLLLKAALLVEESHRG